MKTKLHYVLSITMLLTIFSVSAQTNFFKKIPSENKTSNNSKPAENNQVYEYSYSDLFKQVSKTNKTANNKVSSTTTINLPDADGNFVEYTITEASVMHPDLQAKYPKIRSYTGYKTNSPASKIRFSVSPYKGLTAIILNEENTLTIQPNSNNPNQITVKNKSDYLKKEGFLCETTNLNNSETLKSSSFKDADDSLNRTYDIAISVTGEYATYHGGTLADVNAALVATLTNVNAVFENDFNVTLQLVANNDDVIYLDASTDPYSNFSSYNQELADNLDAVILEENYHVGHLFAAAGYDGNAGCIGCVCNDGGSVSNYNHKGSGYTSDDEPDGINFDIDLVAHEIAHQFGATHTWTYNGNEGFNSQMEPGSGSTIMGYAGIAGSYNIQGHSDSYFHAISIEQITETIVNTTCPIITNTGNTTPTANAGADLTLPIGTAFKLVGTGSDADGDNITYCWEQYNENNAATSYPNSTSTNSNSVLFRSYSPTTENIRYFPNLTDLKYGINFTQWEKIPEVSRTAVFRLTVRDNKPGGANNTHDDMVVTFDANYGPFEITSQNTTNIVWTSGTNETITWNVNNTNNLTGAANVNILLSTDGGETYNAIVNNIPNNGSYTITVPETPAPYCRIMIEPTNNNFFAINSEDFAINYNTLTTCETYSSSSNLGLAITDNSGSFSQNNSIFINDNTNIEDINIGLDISHTYIGDLAIALTSPEGTSITLKSPNDCGSEENILTLFDDEAVTINCLDMASNQSYQSIRGLLSSFDGESLNGNWTLSLGDYAGGDVGTLNSWYIEVCQTNETISNNENNETTELKVYPNPNNGEFTVQFNTTSADFLNLKVIDSSGRIIYYSTYTNTENFSETINLNQLKTGIYFLKVDDGKDEITKKLIII